MTCQEQLVLSTFYYFLNSQIWEPTNFTPPVRLSIGMNMAREQIKEL
jgi:hypothetical protein